MVQGSILGPIIFLLVINDIVVIGDINGTVVIYIYADDTRIHHSLSGDRSQSPLRNRRNRYKFY